MPWNFPYYQVARFAAPNLMLGNTILLKHAAMVPESAQIQEDLMREAGFPEGVYQNVFASNEQISEIVPAVPLAHPAPSLAFDKRVASYPASPVNDEVFTEIDLTE